MGVAATGGDATGPDRDGSRRPNQYPAPAAAAARTTKSRKAPRRPGVRGPEDFGSRSMSAMGRARYIEPRRRAHPGRGAGAAIHRS